MTMPTIPGYTADELESLTPDELQALQYDEGDGAADELAEIAGDEDAAAKPAAGAPGAAAAGDDDTTTTTTDAAQPEAKAPVYTAEAPADAAAQLDAQKAARATAKSEDRAALKQLHDGEIDFAEYEAIKDKADLAMEAADEKIADLKAVLSKAQISEEMTQQETLRAWNGEVSNLMKASKAEGLDYATNAALNKELNGLVRAFGMEATENGMSDVGLAASKWALAQAHAVMKVRHAASLTVQTTAQQRAAGQQRHTLTTLGNLPNADRALVENDTLVKLGQLEGEDLEKAMAAMSPSEVEKLLAGL